MDLLEKVQKKEELSAQEQTAFDRVRGRVEKICLKAHDFNVPVLVDGEDSWIQDIIDELAYRMMLKFNGEKAIVFNTFQMYRTDMLDNLRQAHESAIRSNYFLGVKIVRELTWKRSDSGLRSGDIPIQSIPQKKQRTNRLIKDWSSVC